MAHFPKPGRRGEFSFALLQDAVHFFFFFFLPPLFLRFTPAFRLAARAVPSAVFLGLPPLGLPPPPPPPGSPVCANPPGLKGRKSLLAHRDQGRLAAMILWSLLAAVATAPEEARSAITLPFVGVG